MENFVQNLINMNPEQMQAWIKEQALYGPPPGQVVATPQGEQPPAAPATASPAVAPASARPFAALLPPSPPAQGLSLPVTTTGVSSQQAPLSAILGG